VSKEHRGLKPRVFYFGTLKGYTVFTINKSLNLSTDTNKFNGALPLRMLSTYLVSDLDEQSKHEDDEQVIKDANSSDDDVDKFECEVTDVGKIQHQVVVF